MQDELDAFGSFRERLKNRDAAAANELIASYGMHIERAIRRQNRGQRDRVLFSPEDCQQSIWASIFADVDKLADCKTPEELIKHLGVVAHNKLVDQYRRGRRKKLGFAHEQLVSDSFWNRQDCRVASEPSPSHRIAVADEVAFRTRGLSTVKRTILNLFSQGATSNEISATLGSKKLCGRSIRRMVSSILTLLKR